MSDRAATITVKMPSAMLDTLKDSVNAGEFASTDEAVQDALRLWENRRRNHGETLSAIRARVRRSIEDRSPDLSEREMDEHFEALFASAELTARDAKA